MEPAAAFPPFGAYRRPAARSPVRVITGAVPYRRIAPIAAIIPWEGLVNMLQWNSKRSALLVSAVLVAVSAVSGCLDFIEGLLNFNW
jgi:hypothetical protein